MRHLCAMPLELVSGPIIIYRIWDFDVPGMAIKKITCPKSHLMRPDDRGNYEQLKIGRMKMMKRVMIALLILITACKGKPEQKEREVANIVTPDDKISDMSIYNLPSVWTNPNGEKIELKELKGDVLVMVMFYTSCKIACPR